MTQSVPPSELVGKLTGDQTYYYVARKRDLPKIRKQGIVPSVPIDMPEEQKAVYLFKDRAEMEDAVMNWLGDRYDDDEELVVLTLSGDGLGVQPSSVGYEVISSDPIPESSILSIEDL